MKKPVVLRIYKGDQLLGVKQFVDPQIVIGRQDAQVALEGESISILHASIDQRGEDVYGIMDLGSESGTFRNGERVLDATLESGDTLTVGDYKIEFFVGVPRPKAATPPPPLTVAVTAPAPEPKVEPVAESVAKAADPQPPPPPPTPQEVAPVTAPTPTPTPMPPPPAPAPKAEAPVAPEAPALSHPKIVPPSAPAPVVSSPVKPVTKPTPKPDLESKTEAKPVTPPPPAVPSGPSARIETSSPGVSMGGGAAAMTSAPSTSGPQRVPPPTGRRIAKNKHGSKKHGRFSKTFAAASKHRDVRDFVKPSKGTIIEVLVAWKERVIATHHFSSAKTVTMGSHPSNDIVFPLFASNIRKLPIVKIERQAIVMIAPEMTGTLVRGQDTSSFEELRSQNRLVASGNGATLALEQGEMAQVFIGPDVSVIVRYVSDSPKPLMAPLLDLTASEFVGVVLSIAMVAALWIFTNYYKDPIALPDEGNDEPQRVAMIIMKPPTPPPLPPPADPTPAATPAPTPAATPPPKVVKVKPAETKEAPREAVKKAETATKKAAEGKAAEAAPNKNKTGPRTLTTPKSGGAIKTATKEGSQMQSKSRDVSKMGAFSAFGSGGAQDKLAGATTGSGELAGMAAASSGKAGSATNRAGQGLGSELKDTGVGGNGKSLSGMAGGVGTTGRGSGNSGFGTGGLGDKGGLKIVTGGTEEQIGVGIDKEAIRRVIMANLRVIRSCYEKQLNRHPDLYGKLILSWDIGEQGRVVATRVKSNELGNREVADCITEKLKTWKFPEPPANQVVVVEAYPFFFSN